MPHVGPAEASGVTGCVGTPRLLAAVLAFSGTDPPEIPPLHPHPFPRKANARFKFSFAS
jgi:hypothetical protein